MTTADDTRCGWKIHWGVDQDSTSRCDKPVHLPGDTEHIGAGLPQFPHQLIVWQAGDRREYTGDWPGYCTRLAGQPYEGGCTLHAGHHGRCAP